MKNIIVFLLAAVLLVALPGCIPADNAANSNQPEVLPTYTWNGENDNPIPTVYNLTEEDIESAYHQGNQFAEGRFPIEGREKRIELISNLKKLKLLEKVEAPDKSSTFHSLVYEIQPKNADIITLYFYDDMVDFGQGYYTYTSAYEWPFPGEITSISMGIPESGNAYYNNPADIEKLCSALMPFAGSTSVLVKDDFLKTINAYLVDAKNEHIELYCQEENGMYFLYKGFFSTYIYMGQISRENYDTLLLASKNQFGTHESFSVKSGETTIYPQGHYIFSTEYDEKTGDPTFSDGFPQLREWIDKLESIYYEPNLELSVIREHSTLSITIPGELAEITMEDIKALPPGEHIIACKLTTQHAYVEKAKAYNISAEVYWFRLIKR